VKLDSHQHFWIYDAPQYPWIPKGSPLHRSWLPEDLALIQQPLGFEGSIAVQARQSLEESRWLLALADAHRSIRGVVGWVDLRDPRVDQQLAELSKHPRFVGVRHVVQDEPDPAFMLSQEFQHGISQLAQFDLAYDLLIYPHQLEAALQLVERFPEQRFVLDHIAKPLIRQRTISPWRENIRALAEFPHVCCKVSGMITEANHTGWVPEDFRPYLDPIFEAFGCERLMYGSDWPVCLLAGSYQQTVELVETYAQQFPAAGRDALFGGTAARFYRLND
jgi:L-fuconolactonase